MFNKHNGLKCIYTNVDSLLNKREELRVIAQDQNADIIGLTELKPKNNRYSLQKAELHMEGYDCWPNIDSKGRGVAIYTKTSLQATPVSLHNDKEYEDSVWCSISLHGSDKLLVGCIYRSPNSPGENNQILHTLLKEASTHRASHKLIMGDFNIHT